jgi:hypothetical protein
LFFFRLEQIVCDCLSRILSPFSSLLEMQVCASAAAAAAAPPPPPLRVRGSLWRFLPVAAATPSLTKRVHATNNDGSDNDEPLRAPKKRKCAVITAQTLSSGQSQAQVLRASPYAGDGQGVGRQLRLLRVTEADGAVRMFVHAADLGGVHIAGAKGAHECLFFPTQNLAQQFCPDLNRN